MCRHLKILSVGHIDVGLERMLGVSASTGVVDLQLFIGASLCTVGGDHIVDVSQISTLTGPLGGHIVSVTLRCEQSWLVLGSRTENVRITHTQMKIPISCHGLKHYSVSCRSLHWI